ncbi:MAG: hypothetical protein ACR2HR_04305 [Euzebya sp.]
MFLIAMVHTVSVFRARLAAESGYSTAELLANAALAVGALVVIWGGLRVLGTDVVDWIRGELIQ